MYLTQKDNTRELLFEIINNCVGDLATNIVEISYEFLQNLNKNWFILSYSNVELFI